MQTQILNNDNSIPEGISIAVDTCLFMDAFRKENRDKFRDFFEYLEKNNNELTTTFLVYLEFSRGFNSIKDFNNAKDWFHETIGYIHPMRLLEKKMESLKLLYRRFDKDVDPTDYALGAMLLSYKDKMMVLTSNHKHFSTDLFDIQAFIPFVSKSNIKMYCLYKYSEYKYVQSLKNLEKTIKA